MDKPEWRVISNEHPSFAILKELPQKTQKAQSKNYFFFCALCAFCGNLVS
jgi:hypothetical protein